MASGWTSYGCLFFFSVFLFLLLNNTDFGKIIFQEYGQKAVFSLRHPVLSAALITPDERGIWLAVDSEYPSVHWEYLLVAEWYVCWRLTDAIQSRMRPGFSNYLKKKKKCSWEDFYWHVDVITKRNIIISCYVRNITMNIIKTKQIQSK